MTKSLFIGNNFDDKDAPIFADALEVSFNNCIVDIYKCIMEESSNYIWFNDNVSSCCILLFPNCGSQKPVL